jgi:hypothetical protein
VFCLWYCHLLLDDTSYRLKQSHLNHSQQHSGSRLDTKGQICEFVLLGLSVVCNLYKISFRAYS